MTVSEEVERLPEGALYFADPLPVARDAFLALSIRSVLRASSCAHSSVVADDRLPVPVCEKSGSGL